MQYLTEWLKKWVVFAVFLIPLVGVSQKLTLQQVYDSAKNNYPLLKQKQIIEQTKELTINNLSKGLLPQVNISAQATYQSEVTKVNIPIPGVSIDPLSKDQYRIVADVSQTLYDGGITKQQKELQLLNANAENQKIEVELYKLKERVAQVYLSVLFIDEQLKQTELLKADIQSGIKKVQAQVSNGVAFKSNVNVLKAQLLQTNQKQIELVSTRKGLIDVLGVLMQQPIKATVQLEQPILSSIVQNIVRPELALFDNQSKFIAQQNQLIKAKNLPKISVFAQGGYGRPGLNMLKNTFEPFAIGGLRLNWSLGNLYTEKKEKQLVVLNQQSIQIQKENLLLNINAQEKQQLADIDKINALITTDIEIIEVRESIKNAANAQLENGVITANDYLREVTAEDLAKQALITHKIQLIQSQITLQLIRGQF